jgi:drug/metabolite transporter (DMT)-like permease
VSAVLHIGYFLLLQRGYRAGDVSVVYPLARGTGPLITVIVAVAFLGERPGLHAIVGAAVVIAGVMVIGFAGGRLGMRAAGPGVAYGLLTGCLIAGYTLWDAHAVTTLAVAPVVLSLGSTIGQSVLLAPIALARPARLREVVRGHWRDALVVGILSPVSYIAILFAMQLAPVSIVAPGREVSVVLVGLAGWLLFREPHPVQRLVGAGVVLAGVALLAL